MMNGVSRLPKHATEQTNGATPASASWVKQLWWKYSHSAQRVSPPPRFLLVVLLSVQILFLAMIRLGPSASIWGPSSESPPQRSTLSASVLVGGSSGNNQEFLDGEMEATFSSLNVIPPHKHLQSTSSPSLSSSSRPLPSSLPHEKKPSLKKKASPKQKASLKKMPNLKKRSKPPSGDVPSSYRQIALDETVSSTASAEKVTLDDLLPSADGKVVAETAPRKGASTKDESLAEEIASPMGKILLTTDKQSSKQENSSLQLEGEFSAEVPEEEALIFSSGTKTHSGPEVKDKEEGEFSAEVPKEEVTTSSSGAKAQSEPEVVDKDAVNVEGGSRSEVSTEVPGQVLFEEKVREAEVEGSMKEEEVTEVVPKANLEKVSKAEVEGSMKEEQVTEVVPKADLKIESGMPEEKASESAVSRDFQALNETLVEGMQVMISEKITDKGVVEKEPTLIEQKLSEKTSSSQCRYGYIYVYDLPPAFNHEIVSNCTALNKWLDVCPTLSNGGLGESLGEASPLGQLGSWFISDQFNAEIVFHNRMLQHPCLTDKVELASGFYIPFYAGLDVGRYLWSDVSTEQRDRLSNELLEWLGEQPAWKRSGGSDHFMMIGRITWDFRRSKDEDWGSGFFYKAAVQNTTKLLIERNPWDEKEMAVPYPTNFHPQSDADLMAWQNHLRSLKRNNLFSFAGAPRTRYPDDFRSILFTQCQQAEHCQSLDCSNRTCEDNQKTLELFLDSTFCLQPRGDSFTRRSTFDCLIAGSIPVFFWHRSAYMQYKWHLPVDEVSYSVFISKEEMRNGKKIEEVLNALAPEKVQRMQEAVIRLVPRIVYAVSGFSLKEEKDAFDVAIEGVMKMFKEINVK